MYKQENKKLLVLAYCTYHNTAMTWLQHRLAPAMQEHHAVIIIPSGIATTYTSFSLWLHMVPWTLQNKAIFKIRLYSKMFPRLLLAKQTSRLILIFFQYFFRSTILNSLRRLLYSSLRLLVRSADDKIIGRSISVAEYARATSLILLYPLTEIPLTVK